MGVREQVTQAAATPATAVEILPGAPQSLLDTKRWWKHKNLRALNFSLLVPLLSIFSQGVRIYQHQLGQSLPNMLIYGKQFDGSMMNGLQAVENWRAFFGAPTGATLGIFNAAYPLGGIVGVFFLAPVADTWGRRPGLAIGAAVSILGAILQGAAQNMAMFIISRVIIGVGSVLVAGVGAPWITEIAHPSHRATATALFLTFYSLGSIVAGWTVS